MPHHHPKAVFFLLISLFIGSFYGWGQEKKQEHIRDLPSKFRPGILWYFSGLSVPKTDHNRKYDRLMIDLVYNSWYGDKSYFSSPWKSIGFNVSFLFDIPMSRNDRTSFGIGLAYSHMNNRSPLQFNTDFEKGTTTITSYTPENQPKKSRFGANFIEIPIEFRLRTNGWEHFKFMIGGKIGYNFSSFFQETHHIKGKDYKTRYKNFPDLNPLRYGITLRLGIRNWALFGAYYFSPLFTNDNSVKLYPFSLGITISLF